MSDSKWLSKAGNLDDSIDDRTASVESTRTESVPTIKPVKGLKDRTVTSVKEEHRCNMCGAIIPQGTTLCWKCSSESDIGNKNVRNTGHSLALLWRRYKMPLVFGGVACLILVITLVLSLWGSRSNTPNLEDLILTDDILTYQLEDGTIKISQLDEFEVLSSRTIDDHDSSDVRVVLSDDMIERTLIVILTMKTQYKVHLSLFAMIVQHITIRKVLMKTLNRMLNMFQENSSVMMFLNTSTAAV